MIIYTTTPPHTSLFIQFFQAISAPVAKTKKASYTYNQKVSMIKTKKVTDKFLVIQNSKKLLEEAKKTSRKAFEQKHFAPKKALFSFINKIKTA